MNSNNKKTGRDREQAHHRYHHHPFLPALDQQQQLQPPMASESEEGHQQQQQQQQLQKKHSNASNSTTQLMSSNTTVYTSSMSMFGSRLDDEDPVFSLDEEVRAKEESGERTRHYTADFDPTVSDDDFDEFAKDVGNLHGGRAYSTSSHRFPPRTRHSGRSGQQHNTTGLIHPKLHSTGPPSLIPASLPIAISRGFNWPPRELVGSLSEEEEASETKTTTGTIRAKVLPPPALPEAIVIGVKKQNPTNDMHGSDREDKDLYDRIQAYSRSIQPADDPERLFGERPRRRRSLRYGGDGSDVPDLEDSGGENIPPVATRTTGTGRARLESAASVRSVTAVAHDLNNPQTATAAESAIGTPRIIVPASLTAG